MKVWIARDVSETESECGVFFGNTKPKFFDVTNAFAIADFNMSIKKFAKRFDFTPRKGSCKRYELELKELKK